MTHVSTATILRLTGLIEEPVKIKWDGRDHVPDVSERNGLVYDWSGYPPEERKKIYWTEHSAYFSRWWTMQKEHRLHTGSRDDRNFPSYRFTIFFMNMILNKKHGVNWNKTRKHMDIYLKRGGKWGTLNYPFFVKWYRDDTSHFEPFYVEACEVLGYEIAVDGYNRISPRETLKQLKEAADGRKETV